MRSATMRRLANPIAMLAAVAALALVAGCAPDPFAGSDVSGAYAVDHGAGLYLIDPKGKLRVYLGPGKGAQALAHDLGRLLEGA